MVTAEKGFARKFRHWRRAAKFALLRKVLVPVASVLFRAWFRSLRLRIHAPELLDDVQAQAHGATLGILHGCGPASLAVLWKVNRQHGVRIATLVSPSRDGELMGDLISGFGGIPVVGSSKRGGAAGLIRLIREGRAGTWTMIAFDGPRGPLGVAKPGLFKLAATAPGPFYVVHITASSAIRTRAWDRAFFPLPFARVEASTRLVWPGPDQIPADQQGRLREALAELMTSMGDDPATLAPLPKREVPDA